MGPEWVISVLVGGSVWLACCGASFHGMPQPRHALGRGGTGLAMLGITDRVLRGLGANRWTRRVMRPESLRRRLELAGSQRDLQSTLGLGATAGLSCGAITLLLGLLAPPLMAVSPMAALAGARFFELALARRARSRQQRMASNVPDLVELLVATTDAGLSPAVALKRTAPILRGPLGDELTETVAEVELGVPWQQAIQRMVTRNEVPSLRSLAAALSRSQQLGTVLSSTLRRVADDLRRERRARAEEIARKAPIKMLFPLVFLILPAFILLTVGPVVLATIKSLH